MYFPCTTPNFDFQRFSAMKHSKQRNVKDKHFQAFLLLLFLFNSMHHPNGILRLQKCRRAKKDRETTKKNARQIAAISTVME